MKKLTDIAIRLRLRRAWCALAHEWTQHRGFWRCAACQPETRRSKPKPAADPRQAPLPIETAPETEGPQE